MGGGGIPPLGMSAVGIVTVLYNSAEALQAFAPDLVGAAAIYAVDNSSADKSIETTRSLGATVYALSENIGFGSACNLGASKVREPLVLFANPDVRLTVDVVGAMATALESDAGLFAVAPMLRTGSGEVAQKDQNHILDGTASASSPSCLSGACFLVRKNAFMALGGFDERLFLFFEEDDLFHRARAQGWRLKILDGLIVEHRHGASSKPSLRVAWLKAFHTVASRLYIAQKYGLKTSRAKEIRRGVVKALTGLATIRLDRMISGAARVAAALSPGGGPPVPEPKKYKIREYPARSAERAS